MEGEGECGLEHVVRLGEGQGLADQAAKSLAKGAVETLDVVRFPLAGQPFHPQERFVVSTPQIGAEAALEALFGRQRQTIPEFEGCLFAAAGRRLKASVLPKTPFHGNPQPPRLFFLAHKRPKFIHLNHQFVRWGETDRLDLAHCQGPFFIRGQPSSSGEACSSASVLAKKGVRSARDIL